MVMPDKAMVKRKKADQESKCDHPDFKTSMIDQVHSK